MQHLREAQSIEDMSLVASDIVNSLGSCRVILLKGELGAGKTTLAQFIFKLLGSQQTVTSPTFSIVNEYTLKTGVGYHFDLYRIQDSSELDGIGFMEYLDSGRLCLIEWPEIAENYLSDFSVMEVVIHKHHESRKVELNYPITA